MLNQTLLGISALEPKAEAGLPTKRGMPVFNLSFVVMDISFIQVSKTVPAARSNSQPRWSSMCY